MKTRGAKISEETVSSDHVKALEEAFQAFSQHTVSLQQTYRRLEKEADRVNLELENTNRRLKRKVRELDELNNFQRSILSSVPVAIVVTDLDGSIRAFNPAAGQVWGVSCAEAVNSSYRKVMGRHGWILRSVLRGRCRRESLRRRVGKTSRVISSTACLVEDSEGRPIGAVQLDQDVTRLTRLEEGMCHRQKLVDMGKIAAGFAHEVKKPLNGIKGFASLLRRRCSADDEGMKYAGHIIEAADRLNRMLGRIMGFASPGALDVRTCDLQEQVDRVAEFMRFEDPNGDIHIKVAVPETARFVMADPDKLQQILLNLIKNAVEASKGSEEVVVRSYEENCNGARGVRIQVADNGSGMSEETLARITEPFVSETESGVGMGLAVVDRLLRLHDSTLSAESEPGVGTRMEFVLKAPDGKEEDD